MDQQNSLEKLIGNFCHRSRYIYEAFLLLHFCVLELARRRVVPAVFHTRTARKRAAALTQVRVVLRRQIPKDKEVFDALR